MVSRITGWGQKLSCHVGPFIFILRPVPVRLRAAKHPGIFLERTLRSFASSGMAPARTVHQEAAET